MSSQDAILAPSHWALFRDNYRFIKPHLRLVLFSLAVILFLSLLSMFEPLAAGFIFDEVFSSRDLRLLLVVVGLLVLAQIIRKALEFFRDYLSRYISARVQHELRRKVFGYFESLQLKHYSEMTVGEYMWRLGQDVAQVQAMVATSVPQAFQTVADLFLMAGLAMFIDWKLCLIALAIVPVFIFNSVWTFKRFSFYEKDLQAREAELNGFVKENIAGIEEVKINNTEGVQGLRYLRLVSKKIRAELEGGLFYNLFTAASDLPTILWTAAITFYAAFRVIQGAISVGQYVAVTGFLLRIFGPLNSLSMLYQQIVYQLMSAARVDQLMSGATEGTVGGSETLEKIERIEFVNAAFRYPGENRDAVSGFDLTINKGEKIAIVGPIGCGKTTVIKLLSQFHQLSQGNILINGVPLERLDRAWLRGKIGVVLQRPTVFDDSVLNNIKLSNRSLSDEDVVHRLKEIGLHRYFEELDGGLNKRTGEEGSRLSGGQRQLLAIARAYVKGGEILVFDEATASLDSFTEAKINAAVEHLMKGRTTIIIAHRLSSILNVDRILYMKDGRILEQGSLSELQEKNGHFMELYRSFYGDKALVAGPALGPVGSASNLITLWDRSAVGSSEMEFEGRLSVTKQFSEGGELCVDLQGVKGYCAERCYSASLSSRFSKERLEALSLDVFLPEKTATGWGQSLMFNVVLQTDASPWMDLGQQVLRPGWNFVLLDSFATTGVRRVSFVFTAGAPCDGPVYLTNIKGAFADASR